MTKKNHNESAESIESNGGGGIERRVIVQGAAWSIPVVAFAAATSAAAASQPVRSFDLAVTTVAVGEQSTLTFPRGSVGPDTGMFVDIRIINNGPDAVTGIRVDGDFAAVFTNDNTTDTTRRPYITDGRWARAGSFQYTNPNLTDAAIRSVFFFTRADLTLQPGEATTLRMYFWTKRQITRQGTVNVVGRVSPTSGTDANTTNNEGTSQLYTVRP